MPQSGSVALWTLAGRQGFRFRGLNVHVHDRTCSAFSFLSSASNDHGALPLIQFSRYKGWQQGSTIIRRTLFLCARISNEINTDLSQWLARTEMGSLSPRYWAVAPDYSTDWAIYEWQVAALPTALHAGAPLAAQQTYKAS